MSIVRLGYVSKLHIGIICFYKFICIMKQCTQRVSVKFGNTFGAFSTATGSANLIRTAEGSVHKTDNIFNLAP